MRLLHTTKHTVKEFIHEVVPRYAILSHTWEDEEVTLQDIETGAANSKRGFVKVKDCCAYAKEKGEFDYVWIDTCCIDKTSSAELAEAINSMYRWYQEADICYGFLADVSREEEMSGCKWLTRGWTLQELIAPPNLLFLNKNWEELGTKGDLAESISRWTGIPVSVLEGTADIETLSIAQRMSWASTRRTTRLEDQAYCLMGLFGINMPLIYGEGRRAFTRLQEEIMRISDDHSILAWRAEDGDEHHGGLLATSSRAFRDSGDILTSHDLSSVLHASTPLTVTSRGIHLEVPFLPVGPGGLGLAILNCVQLNKSNMAMAVYVKDLAFTLKYFERVWCDKLESIDLSTYRSAQHPLTSMIVRQPRLLGRGNIQTRRFGQLETVRQFASRPVGSGRPQSDPTITKSQQAILDAVRSGDMQTLEVSVTTLNADAPDKDGRTPLSHAAGGGHEEAVWFLLMQSTVKPDTKDDQGRTPLSHAAENGHMAVIWLLLMRSDVLVHCADASGLTPLSYASRKGHLDVLEMILGQVRSRQELYDGDGRTPLSYASESGKIDIVNALLTRGDVEPDVADNKGRTPLYWAISRRRHDLIPLLLGKGANLEGLLRDKGGLSSEHRLGLIQGAFQSRDIHIIGLLLEHGVDTEVLTTAGTTALVLAAEKSDYGLARLLLDHGADVSVENKVGHTPLVLAAENGDYELARLLLDHGADASVKNKAGYTPLTIAAQLKDSRFVELILQYNADLEAGDPLYFAISNHDHDTLALLLRHNAQTDRRNIRHETALHHATYSRDLNAVRLLLEHQADPKKKDIKGQTALHYAAGFGDTAIVSLLLAHGADMGAKDSKEEDALLHAVRRQSGDSVRLLLERGANVQTRDASLQSPMHWAVRNGACDMIRLLHEFGADVEATDSMLLTPLLAAAARGRGEVVELLLSYGANINVKGKNGLSPKMAADKNGDKHTLALLMSVDGDNDATLESLKGASRRLVGKLKSTLDLGSVAYTEGGGVNVLQTGSYKMAF